MSCIVIFGALFKRMVLLNLVTGLLRVSRMGDTLNSRLSDHDIQHDFMVSPIKDELCKLLKAEPLIDSDIFAGATLNIAGLLKRISLHTGG